MKATKNTLTRQRPANVRKHRAQTHANFLFFEDEGVVSCNGPVMVYAANKDGKKTDRELAGKALLVSDMKRLAKGLPRGKLGKEIELTAEKGLLLVKDARGTVQSAPLQLRTPPHDFREQLPHHDDYYEVAANPRELRAAIMSVEQLESDRKLKAAQPSVTLRVSKNPEHPIEICGKGGNFAAVAPQTKVFIAHVFERISKWFKALGKSPDSAQSATSGRPDTSTHAQAQSARLEKVAA